MGRGYAMNRYEEHATGMFYMLVLAVFELISPSKWYLLHLAWLSYAVHMLH